MCLPAPASRTFDRLPSSAFQVIAPSGKSRPAPDCLITSTGSNEGASQAIGYTARAPQFFAAAMGNV
eukprot:3340932-Pyramimonas_sp.AAC.1